uniref:Uncharacterized protein n=1 Tax=Acrobeloides nanus TaxID=290746 RepID=A0A914D2I5_9BILA
MAIENANRRAMVLTVFIQTHKAWRGHHFVWALWAVTSIILIWATGEDYEFYGMNEKSRVLVITRTEAKSRIYYSGKRVRIPAPSLNVNPVQVIDNAYYEIFHDSF